MALVNVNGNYAKVRVDRIDRGLVNVSVYRSEAVRRAGALPEFESIKQESLLVPLDLSALADGTKSIADNITSAAYAALKKVSPWDAWQDA